MFWPEAIHTDPHRIRIATEPVRRTAALSGAARYADGDRLIAGESGRALRVDDAPLALMCQGVAFEVAAIGVRPASQCAPVFLTIDSIAIAELTLRALFVVEALDALPSRGFAPHPGGTPEIVAAPPFAHAILASFTYRAARVVETDNALVLKLIAHPPDRAASIRPATGLACVGLAAGCLYGTVRRCQAFNASVDVNITDSCQAVLTLSAVVDPNLDLLGLGVGR